MVKSTTPMRLAGFVLCAVLVPAAAYADEVFLKDAGSIKGRIVEQTKDTVKVDVGGGVLGVPMDRVDRIVKGRTPLDDYDEQAKKLQPTDVEGWKKLGRWAAQAGIPAQSHDAYKHVRKLSPNDAEANTALGFVELDGRWVTQEESYKAKGYVKYDGEWMTVAEAQLYQQKESNDRARKDAENRALDAEAAARDAEDRAKKAEREAKEVQRYNAFYGGFGYGLNMIPTELQIAPTFTPQSEILNGFDN